MLALNGPEIPLQAEVTGPGGLIAFEKQFAEKLKFCRFEARRGISLFLDLNQTEIPHGSEMIN